jgi:magnesium-transporting ATPase (P-type)
MKETAQTRPNDHRADDYGEASSGEPREDDAWHELAAEDALRALHSGRDGISDASARRRLEAFGDNQVGERREVSAWAVLLHQFTSPLIYVLLAALAATLAIGLITGEQRWADAIVIGAVLVINATIGFFQEYHAEHAVEELMKMVAPKATVIRDGRPREIDATTLVPGDVVRIGQGGVVPADLRLIDVQGLQANEAALTGESVPVHKSARPLREAGADLGLAEQQNMAFMGTAVTSGRATGLVVATGQDTAIGRIAEQIEATEQTQTPLERRIRQLSIWITWGILVVAAIAFGVGLLMGHDWTSMLLLGIALAVAAVPEGLPIVVTVALAIGVRRMAQRHAVIRRLPAVDTLGACTTIISDKTGTLTENRMTVRSLYAGGNDYALRGKVRAREGKVELDGSAVDVQAQRALFETLLVGVLCNDAQLGEPSERGKRQRSGDAGNDGDRDREASQGDPMEVALLYAAYKAGLDPSELRARWRRTDEIPFQTERRFMATIHAATIHEPRDGRPRRDDVLGAPLVAIKGAPEAVLDMCHALRGADGEEAPLDRDKLRAANEALAGRGLRVLAMAMGEGDDAVDAVKRDQPARRFVFAGFQGMLDPPRASAAQAVDDCHRAGIRAIMVTGDHARTAAAIARQVHIDRPVEHDSAHAVEQEPVRDRDRDRRRGSAEIRVRLDVGAFPNGWTPAPGELISVQTRMPKEREVRVVLEMAGADGRAGRSGAERSSSEQAQEQANGRLPEVHTGADIEDWSDEELDEALGRVNVFARVEPIQKTRLVERLKANNEIVAVTGDGVNDAPALKAAHIGAAMGAGTDVAKEASDMVVTDNNFASVYHAVEEGRTAFRNVRMATFFLLSTGAAIVIMILTALGLDWPLPLLPAQILWLNVVTNGIADVALAFEPGEKALFRRPPRPPNEGVLDRTLIERLVLVGIWLAAGSLGVFLWQWGFDFRTFTPGSDDNLALARTAALTTMVLFQMVHVFNCRSEDVSVFRKSLFSNKVLFLGVLASLGVHVTAIYLPWMQQLLGLTGLDLNTWLWAAAVAATAIIVNELHKRLRPKRPRGAPAAGRQAALA